MQLPFDITASRAWGVFGGLVATIALLSVVGSRCSRDDGKPTSPSAIRDRSSANGSAAGSAPDAADTRRHPSGEMRDGLVELPLATIQLLRIDAIDDGTGMLNSRLTEMLLFTTTEATKVNGVFAAFFARFLEMEAEHSDLVRSGGDTYIAVKGCASEMAPLFSSFLDELSGIIERNRAEALCALVKKELRKGGAEPLEVGFVIINEKGDGAVSLKGGPYGQTEIRGRMDHFARWKVLSDRFFSDR